MKQHRILLPLVLCAVPLLSRAQEAVMDILNESHYVLSDGTKVDLFRSTKDPNTWYYLPTNLHLSKNAAGDPHFLYLKYVTEKREDQGGAAGAILSAMFEYGLSASQLAEVKQMMGSRPPRIRAIGPRRIGSPESFENLQASLNPSIGQGGLKILPAPVTTEGANSFQVISAVLTDKTLTRNLIASGRAPTFDGQKIALAANLGPIGAQLFSAPIEKKMASSDLKLQLNYNYYLLSPAVEATLEISMDKMKTDYQSIVKDYKKIYAHDSPGLIEGIGDFLFGDSDNNQKQVGDTYSESYSQVKFLSDRGYIKCSIKTTVDTEIANKITDGFLQMFVSILTKPEDSDSKNDRDSNEKDAKSTMPDVDRGQDQSTVSSTRYVFDRKSLRRNYTFSASVPIKRPWSVTADLLDIYNGVKSNPKCVSEVLLNDPFFTQREVKVVLDLDAKDIFDETINYATINIRKRRASGRDFLDSITIDAKYLKENGCTASLTYARGQDANPDSFEYQVQWSLRGGKVYPENPDWQVGQFQGVTLAPPLRPASIDFAWDPEEMKAKSITRVVAQVNHWEFGEEQQANIQSVGEQQMRTFKFFRDSSKPEYAYRLIYYHKTLGRLVGPWQRDSGGYIYAAIPDDLTTNAEFAERAKKLIDGAIEKVLGGGQR